MAFQLHPDARNWFKKVRGSDNKGKAPLETLFDVYQLCFSLGIKKGRRTLLELSGDTFMEDFIQRYRPYQMLMIGSMISAKLNLDGISLDDRGAVAREIEKLVVSDGVTTFLSPDGFRELNAYAAGGFDLLREDFEEAPNDMAFLLSRYESLMRS